jgi:hypothetical protein
MVKLFTTLTTISATAMLLTAGLATKRADAAPFGDPSGMRTAAGEIDVVDTVQYLYGGRRYCWIEDGWNGPGWYWCGYGARVGLGWGGPVGWSVARGWRGGGVGRVGRVGGVGRVGRVGGAGRVGRVGGGRVGGGRVGGGRVGGGRVGGPGRGGGRVGGGRVGGGRVGGGRVGGGRMGGGGRGGRGGGGRGGGRRSDITLKHNISLLGHLDNGLGFYRFSYVGSDKAWVGVIAQEVQPLMPEAVRLDRDGHLRVFYDKVGVKFQSYDEWVKGGAHVPSGKPLAH